MWTSTSTSLDKVIHFLQYRLMLVLSFSSKSAGQYCSLHRVSVLVVCRCLRQTEGSLASTVRLIFAFPP